MRHQLIQKTVFKALEISSKVNVGKIKEPKEGKKVTAAEFVLERQKLIEEMRKNMPAGNGNGTFRMRIN